MPTNEHERLIVVVVSRNFSQIAATISSFLDVDGFPERESFSVNCRPSLKRFNRPKVPDRFNESSPKAALIVAYVSVGFLPSLKRNLTRAPLFVNFGRAGNGIRNEVTNRV